MPTVFLHTTAAGMLSKQSLSNLQQLKGIRVHVGKWFPLALLGINKTALNSETLQNYWRHMLIAQGTALTSAPYADRLPVRHNCFWVCPEGLDEAEDVVPSATVEACAVLPQLEQDLIHFKGSRQGLDQNCSLRPCDRQAHWQYLQMLNHNDSV